MTGRRPGRSRPEEDVGVGRFDHALQVQAVPGIERRCAATPDGVGELPVHRPVHVRPRRPCAIQGGPSAGTEDLDVGAEDLGRRRRRHRRLAEPAYLVVEHEPYPSPAVAVRLDAHDRAQDGLEQVEQVDALIAEDAALGAPRADGSAGAMAAGDEPARATVRLDPPDLDVEETAYLRG